MGDAGEGLVDNESRIQERVEELRAERANSKKPGLKAPEEMRKIESLRLGRKLMSNQFENSSSVTRRAQIQNAIADIDKQIAEVQAVIDSR